MMTDKQIIDGVDVSKCGQSCYACDNKGAPTERVRCNREYKARICYCDEFSDCYYKQLKRKEQECEELKKEQSEIKKYLGISHKTILERLEELTDFRDKDREQPDQLKAENEELKQWQEDAENILKTQLDNFDKVENRYKQALDEIWDIAVDGRCFYDEIEQQDEREWFEQILDIINKAKDGE